MANMFKASLLAKLQRDWRSSQVDNFDIHRFSREKESTARWKRLAISMGALRLRSLFRTATILRHAGELEWTYRHLEDDESRCWLTSVMAYRALGGDRVKLDTNNPDRQRSIETVERDLIIAKSAQIQPDGQSLDDFDLHPLGIPIILRGRMGNVLYPFLFRQYQLKRGGRELSAGPGDVVIDAGGCFGDTALYFADVVGSSGKVYCYEFDPTNLVVYEHNMRINPGLSDRIQLVENALWSLPDREMHFLADGAGTRLDPKDTNSPNGKTVLTDTIDAMVDRLGVAKVDFIKMDIEGAELDALKGSRDTIQRDRPKLAICLYHRLEHFWEIPKFIDSLDCGYKFWLGHFTIHAEETVLFAEAGR